MGTREELLDTSERFARQKGFKGFSFAHLAEEVGISKASVYHHFKSKSDLLLALLQRYAQDEREFLDEISAENKTAKGRLDAFIEGCRFELDKGELLALTIVFCIDPTGLSEAVQKELSDFYKFYIGWLTDTFKMAQKDKTVTGVLDPEAEAYSLYALADGAQVLAYVSADTTIFDKAMVPIRTRFV